jgi:hypothetical protein
MNRSNIDLSGITKNIHGTEKARVERVVDRNV